MIPKNWRWTTLENVSDVIMGQSPSGEETTSDSTYIPLIGGAADMGNLFPVITRYTKVPTKLSQKDDVIICVRATLGRPIYSDGVYCLGRGVAAIRSNILIKEYIRYFLINNEQYLYENATGSTFLQITSIKLKSMPIPVPPLDEQQRIVDIIENLFSKLEKAKKLAQNIIDNYELRRSAILNKAFTGQLTNSNLDRWQKTNLESILLPMKTKKPSGDYFRYIDIDSIDNKRQVVKRAKVIETKEAPSRASREIEMDNILFSMVRPYLKNIALIDEQLKDCIASTGFYICRCKENVIPKFLYRFLCSDETINYLMQFMRGDNSPSIRKDDFLNTKINLPNINEQKEIVRILDSLLAKEQRTKELAEQVLQEIDLMKKSILARAFRGELII